MPETPRDGQWQPGLAVLGPALTTLAVLVVASELILTRLALALAPAPARPDPGSPRRGSRPRSRPADRPPR
jgi:hypothetical protein